MEDKHRNCLTDQPSQRRVAYIYNDELLSLSDKLPKIIGRASTVHSLIKAYGLLGKMRLVSPTPATDQDLSLFHSQPYVDCLRRISARDDDEKYDEEAEQFGLTFDCLAWPGVFECASYITGGTVTAAKCITRQMVDTAVHWTGGWHHAKRDEASGFCYLNDIVIGILKLREKFERVLYVDIDVHHGDGVEDAFCATQKVMTVSFHKYSPGFFPGTGGLDDIGIGKGKYYTINVPLKDGIQDEQFVCTFKRVLALVYDKFRPQAVVAQCGADCLVQDPMNSFNLSSEAYIKCVQYVLSWKLPLLVVGGGGYNTANTARCWTKITGCVLGEDLPEDIPEHPNFPLYGPDYCLSVNPGNRPNLCSKEYLDGVISQIHENLQKVVIR